MVAAVVVVKVVEAASQGVRGTLLEQHVRDFCVHTWPELLAVSIAAEIFEVCRGILHGADSLRSESLSPSLSNGSHPQKIRSRRGR